MIYRDDGNMRIIHGDCRHMTELPDNSVHCVVTSPPYWGLRKYAGEQELVWGGDEECKHSWREERNVKRGHPGDKSTLVGSQTADHSKKASNRGTTCSLCGAWRGGFGLEPTIELYIKHSVEVLREIRRVLRKDGVCWYNVGDSYAGSGKGLGSNGTDGGSGTINDISLKLLDLCLIPERLPLAFQADGWCVRSMVIWNKPNPMPESVNGWRWEQHRVKIKGRDIRKQKAGIEATEQLGNSWPDNKGGVFVQMAEFQDCPGCPKCSPNDGLILRKGNWRPTDSYEHILMLTKTDSYYCDMEEVREKGVYPAGEFRSGGDEHKSLKAGNRTTEGLHNKNWVSSGGRNLRNVWTFPTHGYSGAHFATFPEKLPEICIKASTPEYGVCSKCGSPWVRVIEKILGPPSSWNGSKFDDGKNLEVHPNVGRREDAKTETLYQEGTTAKRLALLRQQARENGGEYVNERKTLGWRASCECGIDERIPATVLDPFMGSGTTLSVAKRLGRRSIGYDISIDYAPMANDRVGHPTMELI